MSTTIEEKIAIMQAFADGKEIEVSLKGENNWKPASVPVWDWFTDDYRIKPEITLCPYTFEELQAEMAKGKVAVKNISWGHIHIIALVSHDHNEYEEILLSGGNWISYKNLLEFYQWLDGSPCGIKK